MKKLLLIALTLGVWAPLFAQTEIWESFPEIADCNDIAAGPNGVVWVATDGGAYKYDGAYNLEEGSWTEYNTGNTAIFTTDKFQSVFIDRDGNVWLGTYDTSGPAGVFKFDGTNWVRYTTLDGLAFNHVYAITQDTSGDIWFATYGGGVSRLDTDNNWTTFNSNNTEDGLVTNFIYTLAIAPNGDKWFSTYGNGVSRLSSSGWERYNMVGSNSVRGISIDGDGVVWFATFGGLVRFDESVSEEEQWKVFNKTNSDIGANSTNEVYIDWKGNKWLGANDQTSNLGNVSKMQNNSWTIYNSTNNTVLGSSVFAITTDSYGRKWFGTLGGVAVLTDDDALPLQLVSFDGTTENDLVTLSWATTQEENVYGFEIERSKDGRDFTKLGFVEARNDNSPMQRYRYVDASAPGGKIYYRLRMKDLDGSFTLSPIVVVESAGLQNRISVYPNPVKDRLFVDGINYEPLTTRLFDQNGRVRAVTDGNSLDMTPYAAGIYFLKTTDAQGVQESRKVIVEK